MMQSRQYFGYKVRQRMDVNTVEFFVFSARTRDIIQWAGIKRTEDFAKGTQRRLRESRVRAIARFLRSDALNTIPNSILLAFAPDTVEFFPVDENLLKVGYTSEFDFRNACGSQLEWGHIQFEFEPNQADHLKPALIVDGQHRLHGMSEFQEEDVPVLAVSLINAPPQEQAFQFIVINNKAIRVPTDNAKAIIAEIDEDALRRRLLEAGVSYGNMSPILRDINDLAVSPFQNLLDWPHNRDGARLVPLSAIEQALRYLRNEFDFLGEDEDTLFALFCSIWGAVKGSYDDLWGLDNKLMTKVNINALNEFLIDRLRYAWEMELVDVMDPEHVQDYVSNLLAHIPSELWKSEWSIRIQDNANVRQLIKNDLATLLQNSRLARKWTTGLEIVQDAPVVDAED